MDNYSELSAGVGDGQIGFQFEFRCQSCDAKWRSAFKPYRRGQIAKWIDKLTYFVDGRATSMARRGSGGLADIGSKGARDAALGEALAQARQLYSECGNCRKQVCRKCWDSDSGQCTGCANASGRAEHLDGVAAVADGGGIACPACGQRAGSGRFCEACGFDLASTHKSCPGCAAMVARSARFCADCGHGF